MAPSSTYPAAPTGQPEEAVQDADKAKKSSAAAAAVLSDDLSRDSTTDELSRGTEASNGHGVHLAATTAAIA